MKQQRSVLRMALGAAVLGAFASPGAIAQPVAAPATSAAGPSYADLAELADSAPLVLRAQVRRLTALEPERARGVAAGHGRFYVEGRTRALIAGNAVLGESLRYLVDLPLDARGRASAIKGRDVLLFAREAPGRPGEIQLVAPDAQIVWDPAIEARLRGLLVELNGPEAPARVTGVREAIYVPGTLAGEGETQIFLSTANGSAASITITHRPGASPQWGASFSEVFDPEAKPPARDTLVWYRLACALPGRLPTRVNVSATPEDQARADADYTLVRKDLGDCGRTPRA